jgi:hypothetical protein
VREPLIKQDFLSLLRLCLRLCTCAWQGGCRGPPPICVQWRMREASSRNTLYSMIHKKDKIIDLDMCIVTSKPCQILDYLSSLEYAIFRIEILHTWSIHHYLYFYIFQNFWNIKILYLNFENKELQWAWAPKRFFGIYRPYVAAHFLCIALGKIFVNLILKEKGKLCQRLSVLCSPFVGRIHSPTGDRTSWSYL